MHNQIIVFTRTVVLFAAVILIALLVEGQTTTESGSYPTPPPQKEKFVEATELVTPWLGDGECVLLHVDFDIEKGCHIVTFADMNRHDRLAIYNADGSVWHEFRILGLRPDFAFAKSEFLPFTTKYYSSNSPITLILRMKAESPNWYEVEVNEGTRETKFVLREEEPRKWTKSSWSHFLLRTYNLGIDGQRTKLLDKPNGRVIEESADINFETVKFLKAEGDWAFVERWVGNKKYSGWIRWRSGREILVGCIFNGNKVPVARIGAD